MQNFVRFSHNYTTLTHQAVEHERFLMRKDDEEEHSII